ncbi:reverse transcriptase domain-containing protein [Tanacetum coccineum]
MSQPAEQTPTPANSAVRNTIGKGSKQTPDSDPGHLPADKLREICDKHYNQILPIMAEKVHQEKLQSVQARLSFGESSRRHLQTRGKLSFLSQNHVTDREKLEGKEGKALPPRLETLTTYKMRVEWDKADRADRRLQFIPRELITRKMRMTKGDTGNLDRRNKAKIERWAMPTWCHMFNSTLIGSARVWFDKLPSESINSYEVLRKAFLGNFLQQKKYIKDPVEIHHIKQREGELTEAFMERFKTESMHVNGAPECMRISGFMHGITNPDLIKRLNDNIFKTVDEMMSVTTAFLRGEVAVTDQSRKKGPPTWKHNETGRRSSFEKRLEFKNRHKSSKMHDRFTPPHKNAQRDSSNGSYKI